MSSRMGGATAPRCWSLAVPGDGRAGSLPLVITASPGGPGVVRWSFWPWFRNRPEEMPGVNEEERRDHRAGRAATRGHGRVPWRSCSTSRSVLALFAMYGCLGYSGNFFLTLLPTYLKNHRHPRRRRPWGLLASLPFACGVVACRAGGVVSDLLHPPLGRCALGPSGRRRRSA